MKLNTIMLWPVKLLENSVLPAENKAKLIVDKECEFVAMWEHAMNDEDEFDALRVCKEAALFGAAASMRRGQSLRRVFCLGDNLKCWIADHHPPTRALQIVCWFAESCLCEHVDSDKVEA